MIRHHAAWVLPIVGAPMRDAWVAVGGGRVAGVGRGTPGRAARAERDVNVGQVAVMPGLVNAHTHLELSHLAGRIPPASEFTAWIRGVIASRRGRPDANAAEVATGIDRGVNEMVRCGTAVVGDISNTLASFGPLVDSPLASVVFYELIRFNAEDSNGVVE